jgi:NAD(P)-dependent dehydrogenase (short-subunit alcohol dehydrogenase family)
MLFAHKRIIIIGGSSGMGLATAKAATAAGAQVVIASRSRSKLEKARGVIGGDTQVMPLDVRMKRPSRRFLTR